MRRLPFLFSCVILLSSIVGLISGVAFSTDCTTDMDRYISGYTEDGRPIYSPSCFLWDTQSNPNPYPGYCCTSTGFSQCEPPEGKPWTKFPDTSRGCGDLKVIVGGQCGTTVNHCGSQDICSPYCLRVY